MIRCKIREISPCDSASEKPFIAAENAAASLYKYLNQFMDIVNRITTTALPEDLYFFYNSADAYVIKLAVFSQKGITMIAEKLLEFSQTHLHHLVINEGKLEKLVNETNTT